MRKLVLQTERNTQVVDMTAEVRQALEGQSGQAAVIFVPRTTAGAILIAVLGKPHAPSEYLNAYRHAWEVGAVLAVIAAVISAFLIRPQRSPGRRPRRSPALAGSAPLIFPRLAPVALPRAPRLGSP